MKWKEFVINTTVDAEDLVADMLEELGITGVEIVDNEPISKVDKEKMYIDIEANLPPSDGLAKVKFYLDEDENVEPILCEVRNGLQEIAEFMPIGDGKILESETDEEDWINNWKKYFKSFYIDDIFIKPSWEEVPNDANYKVMIEIDPKTSFGTGAHETTKLCILGLRKYMKEKDEILDLGIGSGILSLIALKLGAGHITGTDIDPICMDSTRENMEQNNICSDKYDIMVGNLIDDTELQKKVGENKYDVVLANILADIIVPMTPNAYKCVKPGGYFITSGIIDFKEELVRKTLEEAGFSIVEIIHLGEWVGIVSRK